tara:strand:- start:732 stop:875 length:144 start_codon:yes stop_codon:yes gene_type:complete
MAEFPYRDLELVIDARISGPNLEVPRLANLGSPAKYGVFVVSSGPGS